MFNIPYELAMEKIMEKTGLDSETIELKVSQKIAGLKGLVSKQGAIHIVANELGVKLDKEFTEGKVLIKNLFSGLQKATIVARVLNIFPIATFNYKKTGAPGKVQSLTVADSTGKIRVVIWNENLIQPFEESKVTPGIILKINNAAVRKNTFGNLELHLGSYSELEINPPNIDLKDLPDANSLNKNIYSRSSIADVAENERYEFVATIVQVYDRKPFYESCPICKSSLKESRCLKGHIFENPNYSLKIAAVIDDGTGNILSHYFNKTAEKLIGLTNEEALQKQQELETPEKFIEYIKQRILGKQILVSGLVKKNTFSNEIEFMANTVSYPDLKQEIEKMINS